MVSAQHYEVLSTASCCFLSDENFGIPDIENIMNTVFGSDHFGKEAVSWKQYWNELNMYEEALCLGGNIGDIPMVCPCFIFNGYVMYECAWVDAQLQVQPWHITSLDLSPSQEVLSTKLLQAAITDHEAEHEKCHNNGNISPQENKPGGKNLDQTCLWLAIKWPATTKAGNTTTHYWCIACDKFCANNSCSHALDHADQCDVSIDLNPFHRLTAFLLFSRCWNGTGQF